MNQHDRRDQEVRNYVRNRMAGEIPPEFVSNVMNDVNRTPQRRRGPAWPIFGALATMAAAALAVVIGLNLLNSGGVGDEPSASALASASESVAPSAPASGEPSASAGEEPSLSPSAEPVPTEGEFGPIHSMTPEEAFGTAAQTCETGQLISNAEPTDLSYRIAFPEGWFTNEATGGRSACTLFAPEPFGASDDQAIPPTVAIVVDVPPGGDFGPGGSVITTEEYTVDGVAAVRYDIEPGDGGFVQTRTVVWIVAIAGALPAEVNDRPYLAISTTSDDPAELAERIEVLDLMVATLEITE